MNGDEPASLRPLLDQVVRAMGAPGVDAVEVVFTRWSEVVGPVLARSTRPASITEGVLVLEADDPAVVSHVRYLEAELLERLSELLGADRVRSVAVRVTPARRQRRFLE